MTEEQYMKKINEQFSHENFEVIQWGENSYATSIIKCLDCGRVISINTGELFRKRRKNICSSCHGGMRKDTLKNREKVMEFLKDKATDIEFFMKKQSKNGNPGDRVRFKCNKCGGINEIWVANLVSETHKHAGCVFCSGSKNRKNSDTYEFELRNKWGKKFTLLSDYVDAHTKIKVRCNNCGFIRLVTPIALMRNGVCPKCDCSMSSGEVLISKWLIDHGINYESQKYFPDFDIGLHYYDFYLPDFNLVIEFHGIQHYEFNSFFHKTEDEYNERCIKDCQKKEAALQHGLNYISIKYTLKDDLEEVLNHYISSTTIPQGSRGKCFEIESLPTD